MKRAIHRILITGGSGFVGSHLVRLAQEKFEAHATYREHPLSNTSCFAHRIDLAEIITIHPLLDSLKPDAIIHTAAIADPDSCERYKNDAATINVLATQTMADWCRNNECRLIYTSTDMVFNGEAGRYKETDVPDPQSYYAQTKVRAEEVILKLDSHGVVARVALVYGIGITRAASFFEQMIDRLKRGEQVRLFHDQMRTPILVNNLAEALLELAEHDFSGIIHLGGSERISRWDFGVKTCQMLNLPSHNMEKISMHDVAPLAVRPADVSLDCSLAKQVLQTKLLNCEEGLAWIKHHACKKS